MAERVVGFANGVTLPVAETVLLTLTGSTDQDTSLSSLPTAPTQGARTVAIRGVLTTTAAIATATGLLRVRQLSLTGAALSPASGVLVPVNAAAGEAVPFAFVDTAPPLPACIYVITYAAPTGAASTGNLVAEIEEVN